MSSKRRRALPPVPADASPQLRQYLQAMQEIAETGEGTRGDPLDRKLSIRDLIDSGFAKLKGRFNGYIDPSMFGGGPALVAAPNMTIPPRPDEVYIIPVFNAIIVSWKTPAEMYNNHGLTEIWRAEGEASTFQDAARIGTSGGSMFSDYTVVGGTKYRYWVRFVSTADMKGPWHEPDGTAATAVVSVELLMQELSGQIDESVLSVELREHIAQIDLSILNLNFGLREVDAAIQTEATTRANEDSALAQQITTIAATANTNTAAIQTEATTRANEDSALAQQITTVQSQFNGQLASVQQAMSTQGDTIEGLSAQYTLRLDVNGYVSGFGAYNDGETSDFAVVADRFWIAPPNSEGKVKPFIIDNGKVYIDTAMIREASIEQGLLGPISFGKITDSEGVPVTTVGGKLKGDLIEAENLVVAEAARFNGDVHSTSYIPNVQGWLIRQDGFVEFNNAQIRGNVDLDSLTVNGELPKASTVINHETHNTNQAIGSSGFTDSINQDITVDFLNVPQGGSFSYNYVADMEVELNCRSAGEIALRSHQTEWETFQGVRTWGSSDLPFDNQPHSYISDNTEVTYSFANTVRYRRTGTFYGYNNDANLSQIRPSTRYRGSASLVFKLWVDGVLEVDETRSFNIDFTLQPTWTGNSTTLGSFSHANRTEKISIDIPLNTGNLYIYPAFRGETSIRMQSVLSVNNIRYSGDAPPASARRMIRKINQVALSGDLSRL